MKNFVIPTDIRGEKNDHPIDGFELNETVLPRCAASLTPLTPPLLCRCFVCLQMFKVLLLIYVSLQPVRLHTWNSFEWMYLGYNGDTF